MQYIYSLIAYISRAELFNLVEYKVHTCSACAVNVFVLCRLTSLLRSSIQAIGGARSFLGDVARPPSAVDLVYTQGLYLMSQEN